MKTVKDKAKGKGQKAKRESKKPSDKIRGFIFAFCLLPFAFHCLPVRETNAQVRPVNDYGAIGLQQLLKRLNSTKSVMHIGAHPDDEDSALLAYLARGENARTAYLSLTRGDGGQNIIGSELFESLGVIRTEELLQARRLDGAEQYFTRAFDYGFSKTLAEAKEKWDEKIILCDAVEVIRTFRPLVVISRFSGTPADGHGQHQYAGYIAPLAVKAAADEKQCSGRGMPWQVLKFYVEQGFNATSTPTLRINTGEYDAWLGRSYFEIAMEGRSQHKSQGEGRLELKGEQYSGLNLIDSHVPKLEKETSVFDGIDTTLGGIPKTFTVDEKAVSEYTRRQLAAIQASVQRALQELKPDNQRQILSILAEGKKAADALTSSDGIFSGSKEQLKIFEERNRKAGISDIIWRKSREFNEVVKLAAGIQIEALANQETAAPGEEFPVAVKVFYPANPNIKVKSINLALRCNEFAERGCGETTITKTAEPKGESQNLFRREVAQAAEYFNVKLGQAAKPTQPYWLERERESDLFTWINSESFDNYSPFQLQIFYVETYLEIDGTLIEFMQPIQYRAADAVRGALRRELQIVPALSISLDPQLLIVPKSDKPQMRRVTITVTNNSTKPISGTAKINGWGDESCATAFNLKNKGEKNAIPCDITIPAGYSGDYLFSAEARAGNLYASQEMQTVAYPHIQTHRFYTEAKTMLQILDLKVAPARVGYIMGSGDAVPEAIRQMGLSVEMLNENDLTSGDLSRFDVIVVGIRAFQVRADLISNNQRVLEYVRNGGNLIVQYQRPEYENLLPFPAKIGARVVDENAKVTILEANHPAFNVPNKITETDFIHWVQERNLYSFSTFDANYKPLLEAHDANEAENKGGLVVAEIGKGKYVYTSYAFFRQLPAGVPGAYRLFANLLSLPKAGNLQKNIK
jgi:LmbE family N-acetylglucosaminyl deacetylase